MTMINKKVNIFYFMILTIPLPNAGFESFLNISIFTFDFVMSYNNERDIGYKLMANNDYPEYLQQLHRDLPLIELPNWCTLFAMKKLMYVKTELLNKL